MYSIKIQQLSQRKFVITESLSEEDLFRVNVNDVNIEMIVVSVVEILQFLRALGSAIVTIYVIVVIGKIRCSIVLFIHLLRVIKSIISLMFAIPVLLNEVAE